MLLNLRSTAISLLLLAPVAAAGQQPTASDVAPPPKYDPEIAEMVDAVSADRIEADIRRLANFGTRHTLSDTLSDTRGIGAARRWIKAEFERIARDCGGCLDVVYQRTLVPGGESERIPEDTWVVNVLAFQRGTTHPERYVLMSGDIDSRVSDILDYTSDSPGANDNASGVAGTLEAARVLSDHDFGKTIVYAALSGEEQGLFGGQHLAERAVEQGWQVEAVLNNDMIGNIHGLDGVIDNRTFRIFSQPVSVLETERERTLRRYTGGEVDGPSRQLARYIAAAAELYVPTTDPMMIYRLDRFGRGGHHRPFNDVGFPAVRIMEAHENYTRQHQDLRTEDGIRYGDVIEGVNFDYARKLTAVNTAALASLASAPPPPSNVRIEGAVQPSPTLRWAPVAGAEGYRIYWRRTTEPRWTRSVYVGDVIEHTLENIIIDNYLFGVASVGASGNESVVVFPTPGG